MTWALEKICVLIGSLRPKYIMFELQKYRGVIFHDTEQYANFEEKLTCGLENNMRNLTNFHQSAWKCQNWDFDWIILSKNLKRGIDFSFQNWQEEFNKFWPEHSKIFKGTPCSHRQSRNRMMKTFIIVNITPIAMYVRDSLENKSVLLVLFEKAFRLTLLGQSYYSKEELADYCCFFESYQGIPYFYTG